jgi:ABC-type glycerol-3-phosphate transport system substrate-binding protein
VAPKPGESFGEVDGVLLRWRSIAATALAVVLLGAAGQWAQAGPARVLEIWVHEFPPLQDALTKKWVPEFQAKNPGVRVKVTAIPFVGVVAYDAKLLSALSAGAGPDLWDMGDWHYKVFMENKFLAPLDPAVFGYGSTREMIDAYMPGTTSIFERDGKLFGLFSEYNTLALFYNLDLFKAAGVAPLPADKPVSWNQIAEIAQKLTKRDAAGKLTQIGYRFGFFATFRSPQWYAQDFYTIMRQYGQDDLIVGGKPAANTQAVTQTFQLMHDFTWKDRVYDPSFPANWFADLPKGRVAMLLAGTWFVPAMKPHNPQVRFAVAPHPVVNPEDRSTYHNVQWSWGWSVNANKSAAQKRLAQQFLASMVGKKGETGQPVWWFKNVGYVHPKKAFYQSAGYKQELAKNPWLKAWEDAFKTYKMRYVTHNFDETGQALIRAIDRVVYDEMRPEETARLMQSELQRLLGTR